MRDRRRPFRYSRIAAAWASRMAFVALILLSSCIFWDSDDLYTTAWINFDEDGLTVQINLSRPVTLPVDEDDATFIMMECGCACQGDLELADDYWQYHGQGCSIRIEVSTGDVKCCPSG